MRTRSRPGIQIKTPAQLSAMREAGEAVAAALGAVAAAVAPGVTTADLDAIAAWEIRAAGATASFLGYHGFPATICASVNEEIVHGIPRVGRRLREGDVISIDCGAVVGGWHADAALTVGVGAVAEEVTRLIDACERSLWHGLAAARAGARVGDISHAVERSARTAGDYGIVEDYVGHGIGTQMHMDPAVPNVGRPRRGPVLAKGMALAIEPLLTAGRPDTLLLEDGWTVVSEDGSWSAHFEHTVAVTTDGPWVLTAADGGRDGFARLAGGRAAAAGPVPGDTGAGESGHVVLRGAGTHS